MTQLFNDTVGNAYWFVGVVEDRADPTMTGRVRVRMFGDHTEDKTKIPTSSLPWAQVMMPVTSASIGGIGTSPTGLVNGSWVVGFYLDGDSKQQPLVMGSIPGVASNSNPNVGFSDPAGVHPVRTEEPDTPYTAMPMYYRRHASYISRSDTRVEQVEAASPPQVSSVAADEPASYYERQTWSMPPVAGGASPSYPYNTVSETESGHVIEVDDTPGNERLAAYHTSGTNYEIQADGSKTETIVKDSYTVVFGDNNIYIKGNCNITIDGDLRQLVKGNYHLEVNGNKTELVRGSRQAKINQNDSTEVVQDLAMNVTGNYIKRIGGNETRIVEGSRSATINVNDDLVVTGDLGEFVLGNRSAYTAGNDAKTVGGFVSIAAGGNVILESQSNKIENIDGDVNETYGSNQTTTVTGNMDLNATRIDLN